MNLEALAVIGTLALVAGIVLYLPFRLWFWWRQKKESAEPQRSPGVRITRAGLVFYGAMVGILFVGYAQGVLEPHTTFGPLMNTGLGRMAYAVCVVAVGILLESALVRRGCKFVKRDVGDG